MVDKTVVKDNLAAMLKAVDKLVKSEVLVGVPGSSGERKPGPDGKTALSNADIGYLMEYGSPAQNIPPRPFLVPGIAAAKDKIAAQLKRGGMAALDGKEDVLLSAQMAAGAAAVSSVQATITSGAFAPLSPRTIAARAKRGQTGAKQYQKLKKEGVPEDVLLGTALVKPLIDSGQLRQAITYVIRRRGK